MNISRKVTIFVPWKRETAHVGYTDLCPDSAKQASFDGARCFIGSAFFDQAQTDLA